MKKRRFFLRILGCIAVLSGAYSAQAQTPGLSYPVPLDEEHFPDAGFREEVSSYDGDNDGKLSVEECGSVTQMAMTGMSSLEGIRYFYALTTLNCEDGYLSSLDVSGCTALDTLNCNYNQLTSLDVSGCTALTGLECFGNQLTSLDVSGCTALTGMHCSSNQLTSLDVSGCTALEILYCFGNQLTSLDVSKNTALTGMNCFNNQLTSLDVSKNTALEYLDCRDNRLACLDLSQCKNLYHASYMAQHIDVEADESNRFNLADFIRKHGGDMANVTDCFYLGLSEDGTVTFSLPTEKYSYETGRGQMIVSLTATNYHDYVVAEIDEAHFPDFVFRNYVANNLDFNRNGKIEISESGGFRYDNGQFISSWTALDVSGQGIQDLQGIEYFPLTESIDCSGNNIGRLDLSGLEHLTFLDCSGNLSLARLEVFDNNQLTSLDCSGTSLDLAFSQYPNLHTLACADMGLTTLDLKGCTALTGLDCSGNELVSLDLSGNAALQRLNVNRNRLPALDLSRNTALQEVSTDNNYHLVEADEDRNVYLSTIPGLEADRMDNIQGGSIEGNTLHMEADTLTYYYYYESPSHDAPLGGYFHIALKAEDSPVFIPIDEEHFPDAVFREYIAEADMDANGQLSELEVSGVTGIDVSGMGIQDLRGIEYFTELESLDCSGNELTSLDLSANTKLQSLNAENNRLDIVLDERDRFDLSQLPGFEMAKASDWTGCTRIGNNLTFKQQEVTYSYATGYNGENEDADMTSVIFSLMADRDPSVEPDPGPGTDNEADARQSQGRVYAKDHRICTEGIDTEISIYSASGSLLYRGFDKEIPVRHDGLYLVRSGSRTWKVLVM